MAIFSIHKWMEYILKENFDEKNPFYSTHSKRRMSGWDNRSSLWTNSWRFHHSKLPIICNFFIFTDYIFNIEPITIIMIFKLLNKSSAKWRYSCDRLLLGTEGWVLELSSKSWRITSYQPSWVPQVPHVPCLSLI